jgi:butyrate kinase
MSKQHRLLVINVGSTSTKVASFRDIEPETQENIRYRSEDLADYATLAEQLPRREIDVMNFLKKYMIDLQEIDMVVSRGGLGKPAPAGAYGIDENMCADLLAGKYGQHPSALGPAMALGMARQFGMPAIVIDPPSTDEFEPLARISGLPELERKSAFHALNQKIAARRFAATRGKKYGEINVVVAHLGGGITIGAHRQGRVIDCTHGLGEGPLTPERAGALPTMDLIDLAFSGKFDKKQLQERLVGQGGLAAYLGTTDVQQLEERIKGGDEKARLFLAAMAYQVAKDIGAMSTVLNGELDGIILTGGIAHSEMLTGHIAMRVRFLAPIAIYPGEDEMAALAAGGLRVLEGEEGIMKY